MYIDFASVRIGRSDFTAVVQNTVQDIIVKDCVLLFHTLEGKALLPNLKEVLLVCVRVVNWSSVMRLQYVLGVSVTSLQSLGRNLYPLPDTFWLFE